MVNEIKFYRSPQLVELGAFSILKIIMQFLFSALFLINSNYIVIGLCALLSMINYRVLQYEILLIKTFTIVLLPNTGLDSEVPYKLTLVKISDTGMQLLQLVNTGKDQII